MIVYVSIGNSDDKLTQAEWSEFVWGMVGAVVSLASEVHGEWFSLPSAAWQNACWCLEFGSSEAASRAKEAATRIREKYRQDSVAWAVAETEFI